MADQEFSSPGAHMASLSSSSSSVSYGPPVSNLSNVIYAPRASSLARDSHVGNVPVYRRSKDDDRDDLTNYLAPYMKYNESMYLNSQDWEKMMSDTAIQRQMLDLKKAGINPILAGRLGGAQWHSVNAPYNTISPANAYSQMYQADISESNSIRQVNAELEKTNLTNDNMLQIARENNLNNKEVSALLNATNVVTQGMRDEVDKAGQDKAMISNAISTGVHFLGTLALIASRGNNRGYNGGKVAVNDSVKNAVQDELGYTRTNSLFQGSFDTKDFVTAISIIAGLGLTALTGVPVIA